MGPYYVTALLSLLGPVRRVCAMATRAAQTRTVPSGPAKGTVLPVDVDTHINAILEFCSGAQVTLTCSFDVWDSELPRMELYGTEGTVLIDEKDPIAGPNLFGGDTLMRTPGEYRWADPERRPENVDTPWPVVPNCHPFNSVSHAENPRGIGLVDLAYALQNGRTPRASGDMALHSLEVMECILRSAREHVFCETTTTFEQPEGAAAELPGGKLIRHIKKERRSAAGLRLRLFSLVYGQMLFQRRDIGYGITAEHHVFLADESDAHAAVHVERARDDARAVELLVDDARATVKPFRPMTRLNSVARSRTCMVFGISSMLSSSSEK